MVHTWAKNYVKYDENDVEPVQIFLSDSGGTGKSHLVRVISKILLYHCKDPEKKRVFLHGPTGIPTVNICEPSLILVVQLNQEQSYLV